MNKIKQFVLIICLMLFGGCKIYFDYVARGYATDAKTQMNTIFKDAKLYKNEYGDWPSDVPTLHDANYAQIPQATLDKWDFTISVTDDDNGVLSGTISAISLDAMGGGAGELITYDVLTGRFTGYGQK